MAGVKQVQVTFDCANPRAVAEFWKQVLEYVDPPVPPGFESWDAFDASLPTNVQGSIWACQDPEGIGPRLFFQRVPEPKTVKNRVHVDLEAPDRRAEIARLVALGAEEVGDQEEWGFAWTVLRDPEGNEFCVAQGR